MMSVFTKLLATYAISCLLLAADAATKSARADSVDSGSPFARLEEAFARLVRQLDAPEFEVRERAMLSLAALRETALPLIERSRPNAPPEAARRLDIARLMIQWNIQPEVYADLVPLVREYSALSWMERQERLRQIGAAARKAAIPTLLKLLRAEDDLRVQRTIVRILASRNMWPEGLSALQDVKVPGVELDALLDPRVLISIGNAFLSRGEYDRALREYERAIKLSPDEPIVLYNLGCLYALKDEPDRAFDYLRRSIAAGYDDAEWLQRDPDLKSLHEDPRFAELVEMIQHRKSGGGLPPVREVPILPEKF